MDIKKSPLAPDEFPKMKKIDGVKLAVSACGMKYKDRADLLLVYLSENTKVAGLFTKSTTASANILWGRKIIKNEIARILLVNAGNANAFNGKSGEESIDRIVNKVSEVFCCAKEEVYPCSTGVIGQVLPDHLITDSLENLKSNLQDNIYEDAANAIKTTDTYAKGATIESNIDDKKININAIAKGSGMIAPNMATMLAYIFTDANIEKNILDLLLKEAVDKSFNSITVDSDTSTSDTVLLFATGRAGNDKIDNIDDSRLDNFKNDLDKICLDLAHQIVKDGEGATKFIEIEVKAAQNNEDAKKIAMSIANSPLVKTAIFGEDANWGRIIMAVGKTGCQVNRETINIDIGQINIVKNGLLNPDYVESDLNKHLSGQNIQILVDLGIKDGNSKVWTCDLTYDYIKINGDYRS